MDNAAALPKRFTFHTPQMTAWVLSLVIFSVCVYEKIPLVQRPLPGIVSVNLRKQNKKTPKTLNICNVAIEQSSDLGKDKHLSWPLVEKTKCLYHTSLFVQTSSESHTQKKKSICVKIQNPLKFKYISSSTHWYCSPCNHSVWQGCDPHALTCNWVRHHWGGGVTHSDPGNRLSHGHCHRCHRYCHWRHRNRGCHSLGNGLCEGGWEGGYLRIEVWWRSCGWGCIGLGGCRGTSGSYKVLLGDWPSL